MSDAVLVGSDRCGLDDLFLDYGSEAERGRLGARAGRVPADGPDPAVTVHCGAYDCPHVTLP